MPHMTSKHAATLRKQCLDRLAEAQRDGRGDNARSYAKQADSLEAIIARAQEFESQTRPENRDGHRDPQPTEEAAPAPAQEAQAAVHPGHGA